MESDKLLGAAVLNNALWCDAVCRSHGFPGNVDSRLWVSLDHDLTFYPHVITLILEADPSEVTAVAAGRRHAAVKDSFAQFDLAPAGMRLLLEGEWINHVPIQKGPPDPDLRWSSVTNADELHVWERSWAQHNPEDHPVFLPTLLHDARCVILQAHQDGRLIAGAIAYTAANVIGLSNLWGPALPSSHLWINAIQAVATLDPHLPIVSYEHGTDLIAAQQAGARPLGPLRVWSR
ncbi:hypothetical protein [Actinomadura sp. 6N118]|uniref:hypothetical protein n=1 Tax=Actinomadura sp. 6N118 TaxID=3375151 RepID=UPI003796E9DF